jgi:hypothetical protein
MAVAGWFPSYDDHIFESPLHNRLETFNQLLLYSL